MTQQPIWQPHHSQARQLLPDLYQLSAGACTLLRGDFVAPLRIYDGDPRDGGILRWELTRGAWRVNNVPSGDWRFIHGIYILGTGTFDDVLIAGGMLPEDMP